MAGRASVDNELDDLTECPICRGVFNDPRVLPCNHTFCLQCMLGCGQDRQPGQTMPCPMCREEFTIPPGGLGMTNMNCVMKKLLHARKLSEEKAKHTPSCAVHKDSVAKLFCLECKSAVCMPCFIKTHRNHECFDVEVHEQIMTDTDKVTEDIKKTGELLSGLENGENAVLGQLAEVETKIHERADKLMCAIQRDRKELLSEVESIRQKRIKQRETVEKELAKHKTVLQNFKHCSEIFLSSGQACDVLKSADNLHERAKRLAMFDAGDHVQSSLPPVTVRLTSPVVHTTVRNLIGKISEDRNPEAPANTYNVVLREEQVDAMTSMGDELFVARTHSQQVEAYDTSTFTLRRCLTIPGLGSHPHGLAACPVNNRLYVSDSDKDSVHRVELSGSNAVKKWSVAGRPYGISVNSAQNVLVASQDEGKLQEFTTRGSLVREIQLPFFACPYQAVQLSTDEFLISGDGLLHRVCVVNADGTVLRNYAWPLAQTLASVAIAVDDHGNVLVADCANNRLFILDQSLSIAREIALGNSVLGNPCTLCYVESRRRLYIGEVDSALIVFIDNLDDFTSY